MGNKFYCITREEVIVQTRDYFVLAEDKDAADSKVTNGMFLSESEAVTVDTKSSRTLDIVEIDANRAEDENGNLLP
ncbi:hypothetical protein PBI_DAMIEN_74 [Mycobacterium phage Damien]|uniref:hypothetical protein n=1 Tax=Mycobacterium phage Oaker TaxID=1445727 RepID=UPI0003E36711|nr:hypothetical protein CH12_gp74 [Mycobacterium phage Oaker]YP_009044063.1 hypothetical protein HL12_gp74 [Mycobacterium phage Damien]AVO26052.1 hypothetical protein SEA_THUMB_75 [Mycobacterium phage Thumb]QDH84937.1 hypothetical protein SEA_Phreeze_73 [Mycobacterium phage Phreeze]QLF83958.1 hypothetical protein SEA_BECKERTON_73 [Mycobacterium phage Beckerton]AHG24465.1 hypothetical protein PBI_OAKER_74 [Mycobacterium phage Oaker]AHZ95435.1 hypothetical protein PBI_DAMIEN_74 [Mycobacterium p